MGAYTVRERPSVWQFVHGVLKSRADMAKRDRAVVFGMDAKITSEGRKYEQSRNKGKRYARRKKRKAFRGRFNKNPVLARVKKELEEYEASSAGSSVCSSDSVEVRQCMYSSGFHQNSGRGGFSQANDRHISTGDELESYVDTIHPGNLIVRLYDADDRPEDRVADEVAEGLRTLGIEKRLHYFTIRAVGGCAHYWFSLGTVTGDRRTVTYLSRKGYVDLQNLPNGAVTARPTKALGETITAGLSANKTQCSLGAVFDLEIWIKGATRMARPGRAYLKYNYPRALYEMKKGVMVTRYGQSWDTIYIAQNTN